MKATTWSRLWTSSSPRRRLSSSPVARSWPPGPRRPDGWLTPVGSGPLTAPRSRPGRPTCCCAPNRRRVAASWSWGARCARPIRAWTPTGSRSCPSSAGVSSSRCPGRPANSLVRPGTRCRTRCDATSSPPCARCSPTRTRPACGPPAAWRAPSSHRRTSPPAPRPAHSEAGRAALLADPGEGRGRREAPPEAGGAARSGPRGGQDRRAAVAAGARGTPASRAGAAGSRGTA